MSTIRQYISSLDFKTLAYNICIVAAYYLLGQLDLLLSIPPGYATAIWPPSGLALAISLIYTRKYCFAIGSGAFLFNLFNLFPATQGKDVVVLILVSLCIASASTLQALLGAKIIRKFVPFPDALAEAKTVYRFFMLAAIACTVAPTLGVLSLYIFRLCTFNNVLQTWAIWWSGNMIGVLIFTPITLTLFASPTTVWRARIKTVAIPLLLAFIVSTVFYTYVRKYESSNASKSFEKMANRTTNKIQSNLARVNEVLTGLNSFYKSSKEIDRNEFKSFTQQLLKQNTAIYSLEWMPFITSVERKDFERQVSSEIGNFIITSRNKEGLLVPDTEREWYTPITYVEPEQSNKNALGLNLSSDPVRRHLYERARDSGVIQYTGVISLLRTTLHEPCIQVVLPVYMNGVEVATIQQRHTNIIGYLNATIILKSLIEDVLRGIEQKVALELEIGGQSYYFSNSRINESSSDRNVSVNQFSSPEERLPVGEQDWILRYSFMETTTSHSHGFNSSLVLLGALALSSILGTFLLVITGQSHSIEYAYKQVANAKETLEKAVEARTNELKRTNIKLRAANRLTTEQKHALILARDAAQHSALLKSQFLATISHEIRTPMNGILGMSELMLETDLKEEQREFVQSVKHSAECLMELINDVLDFSKIEAGKLFLSFQPFMIRDEIHNLATVFRVLFTKKEINFNFEILPTVPKVMLGDSHRLRQILNNLLGNALKFTGSGGHVNLRIELKETNPDTITLMFSVSDTGIGIRPEDNNRIFLPFAQADATTTRRFGGTGLGLAICKQLVEMMNGTISFHSEYGKGSTFQFTATFQRCDKQASSAIQNQSIIHDTTTSRPLRIMLAEDNRINQRIACKILEKCGHTVTVVEDGVAAVEAFSSGKFDLILMDIHMPNMNGIDAFKEIRARESNRHPAVPIIALTADAMSDSKKKYLDLGMNDFLSKPFKKSDLLNIVSSFAPNDDN